MRRSRSAPTPKRARALSAPELARISGGYTDDGVQLSVWVPRTDDGDTLRGLHVSDGNGGFSNWAMTDRGDT